MSDFIFDLQKFTEQQVTLNAGETFTQDGIIYTAISDNVLLNFNDTGSTVSGGKFSIQKDGSEETLEFDTTDGSLSFNSMTRELIIAAGTKIYIGGITFTALEDMPATIGINDKGIIYLTFENASNKFEYELGDMKGTADISGAISYKPEGGTIGLITHAEEGNSFVSSVDLTYKNVGLNIKSPSDKSVIFAPVVDEEGTLTVNYPKPSNNTMQTALTLNGERVFSGHEISVNGTLAFNPETNLLGMPNGTELNVWVGGTEYNIVAKAVGDNVVDVSLSDDKITFTPTADDGSTDFSITTNGETVASVNVDISGGSFSLSGSGNNTGVLTFAKDTVIKLDYGDSVISFTVTDDEGGKLSMKNGGFTFTPYSDGGLKVNVIEGAEIPEAIFNVTGEITYKFDSTILLAKGAVIENTFENGNTLTVTALADTTSTIHFTTQDGLTISSEEASEDLNIRISNGDSDIINITSVDGVLHYSYGTFTITDGTELSLTSQFNYNVRTSGGNASFIFDQEKSLCTPEEGATFVIDYLDETTWQLQNGTLKDYYVGPDALSVGSNFKCNDDEGDFLLEDQGTYKLNGIKVNTHADNIAIKLDNYDTIITAYGICYTTTDENVTLDLSETGSTVSGGKVIVSLAGIDDVLEVDTTNGSLTYDSATKTFHFTEGTTLSTQLGDDTLEFVAKNDLSISVNRTDDKLSFNLDGAAEVDVINGDRKATIDFNGALTYDSDGKISLEDGTEITIAWEDGNKLKLTSHGSEGSILLDSEKGIRITSDDDNLDLTLTTADGYSTTISSIKGSLWYKEGTITLDANTFITGKNTVEGHEVGIKFEAVGGTGSLTFSNVGFIYSAGTGKNKVTYTLGDLESSFTVNEGSVFIENRVFNIAEGSDISTDFKDFIPAQYFQTDVAGTYTLNGQTIKTSAANLKVVATDDYMTFNTDGNSVEYNGMNFAGAGNVSLSTDKVVLGTGVDATGFGKDKSFVLAEEGNVTADARIFELDVIDGVPTEITVTGAQDGFVFSRELTKESEAYLDDVLNTDAFEEYTSPNIGKVFAEKFIAEGDSSYRIRTDSIGLEDVIGLSGGVTVTGGASLGESSTLSYYDLITETEGDFTIGKHTYNVSGDSSVAITARFPANGEYYASAFNNLVGTVSGDFSGGLSEGAFSINGSSALKIYGDSSVEFVADENGFETRGLDAGASLQVSASGIYTVNSTAIDAQADDVIVGTSSGAARLYDEHYIENTLSNTLLVGTELADTIFNSGASVTIEALGGDDLIMNANANTLNAGTEGSGVSIVAGDGDDTIYNYHSYYPTISGGAGDDSIVVNSGHRQNIDGGDGNDTIIGSLRSGNDDDWHMGGYATILGGNGDDYIDVGYSDHSSIDGGDGDDTIIANGISATINAGGGSNLIQLTTIEGGETGQFIVFEGYTTVQGFITGFGEGTDTVYFKNDAPACNFIENGLVLYDDDGEDDYARLLFDGVTETTKLNIYYVDGDRHIKEVFISYDDWYIVEEEDFSEESYFVGSTAFPNEGVDFNNIAVPLNISIDTDYEADVNFWVNNIYSVKGGAGNTTITGTAKSDTILSGSGATTIYAGNGGDVLTGNGKTLFNMDDNATATVNGMAGDIINAGGSATTPIIFMTNGTAYFVDGELQGISDEAIVKAGDSYITGNPEILFSDGDSITVDSDTKEILVGKRGATVSGYNLNAAFVVGASSASALAEEMLDGTYTVDDKTFHDREQKDIYLADDDTSKGAFVKFKTADDEKNIFGWTSTAGGTIDGSSIDKKQILISTAKRGKTLLRGGSKNDTIFAGTDDTIKASGGHDEIHLEHGYGGGVVIDLGDGSEQSTMTLADGLDLTEDVIKIASTADIKLSVADDKLTVRNVNTRLILDEIPNFDAANGLQIAVGDEIYTLRSDYDSGMSNVDYFWQDINDRYYKHDTNFYIDQTENNRIYHIDNGSGRATIDGFAFGSDGDAININSAEQVDILGDDLLINSGNGDRVRIVNGANKIVNFEIGDRIYTATLGKTVNYNNEAEYFGDVHASSGCAVNVGSDYADDEVAVYLNEAPETNGKVKQYLGVDQIDASAYGGRASLIGGDLDDKITAAQGATSLWGGNGGDDILIGTGSGNEFFYFKGNGRDVIRNAADGDIVNVFDVTLDDISSTRITDSNVAVEFKDGGSLTFDGTADATFKLSDGSAWKANRQASEWRQI